MLIGKFSATASAHHFAIVELGGYHPRRTVVTETAGGLWGRH